MAAYKCQAGTAHALIMIAMMHDYKYEHRSIACHSAASDLYRYDISTATPPQCCTEHEHASSAVWLASDYWMQYILALNLNPWGRSHVMLVK